MRSTQATSSLSKTVPVDVLVEEGIVEEGLRDSLRAMAQFRNRLVRLYWDVDDEKIYEFRQTALSDMDRFAGAVARRIW